MSSTERSRFARTDPFLDELDAIGYIAIPKSELAHLTQVVDRVRAYVSVSVDGDEGESGRVGLWDGAQVTTEFATAGDLYHDLLAIVAAGDQVPAAVWQRTQAEQGWIEHIEGPQT